ncbi:BCCT family transporter, partial [Shewanella sp. 0m-11]
SNGGTYLSDAVSSDVSVALFVFFEHMPFSTLLSTIALCLVVTFFVTSSDSGSLVIDNLTSGGDHDAPVWQRIFWALMQGVVASVLLLAGGLQALQTAAIASALPFLIVMLLMCFGLYIALKDDWLKINSVQSHNTSVQFTKTNVSWESHIDVLLSHPSQEEAQSFLDSVAQPALTKVRDSFLSRSITAEILNFDNRVRFVVPSEDHNDFVYGLRTRAFSITNPLESEVADGDIEYYRVEVFLEHGGQHYDVMGFTQDQLLADVVTQYEKYLHYLHLSSSEYLGSEAK